MEEGGRREEQSRKQEGRRDETGKRRFQGYEGSGGPTIGGTLGAHSMLKIGGRWEVSIVAYSEGASGCTKKTTALEACLKKKISNSALPAVGTTGHNKFYVEASGNLNP
jgi:hypothetical protein